jgi:hypothetical protein
VVRRTQHKAERRSSKRWEKEAWVLEAKRRKQPQTDPPSKDGQAASLWPSLWGMLLLVTSDVKSPGF